VKEPYKIYFLSEEAEPEFTEHITLIKTGKGEWGKRLLYGFSQIPEEHVFYMQEDFWPKQPTDLSPYFEIFQEYNMDALRISGIWWNYYAEHIKDKLYKFTTSSKYLMTHQFSLWNKAFFMKYIGEDDTPWRNELDKTEIIRRNPPFSIYLIDNQWYNSTVRKGVLGKIGEEMVAAMDRELLLAKVDAVNGQSK
jgi:hypothetical protein